ncbi:MAG: HD domain-containing protein, partial [Candidatus Brocadiia bacterium]
MDSTAEPSAEGSVLPALGVHPRVFLPSTTPPFNLYVRTANDGSFHLFHKAGRPVYANTWDQLERGGFDMLYVRGDDRDRCFDYVEGNLSGVITEGGVPDPSAARWTYRLAVRSMDNVLGQPGAASAYRRLEGVLAPVVQALRHRPGIEWDMLDSAPLHYRTPCHCVNVCVLLTAFALHVLEIKDDVTLAQIALGGVLHDLGKVMVPESILSKPDELTRGEFAKITQHPRFGADMARPFLPDSSLTEIIIFQHHEDTCGSGYPEGRSGDDIHLFAKVARVVDVFDAITTHRPYGTALDEYRALNAMVSGMRRQFDMDVLRRFIRYVGAQSADGVPIAMPVDRSPDRQPADSVIPVAEVAEDEEEESLVELHALEELQPAAGEEEVPLALQPLEDGEPQADVQPPPEPD